MGIAPGYGLPPGQQPVQVRYGEAPHQETYAHGAYGTVPMVSEYGPMQGGKKPQYETLSSIMQGANEQQIITWQIALMGIGKITGEIRWGLWDQESIDAMNEAAVEAGYNGVTLGDYVFGGQRKGWAKAGSDIVAGTTGGGSSAAPVDNSPAVYTQESISLSNRGTAKSILSSALAAELGREPSKKEVTQFLKGLNRAERNSPSTSTTTTTEGATSNDTNSSTVTKPSKVDPTLKAEHFAKRIDPKEAHKYQTGNYYNVIASMLGI